MSSPKITRMLGCFAAAMSPPFSSRAPCARSKMRSLRRASTCLEVQRGLPRGADAGLRLRNGLVVDAVGAEIGLIGHAAAMVDAPRRRAPRGQAGDHPAGRDG